MCSLENRRLVPDELVLYKIHPGLFKTTLNHAINFNHPTRFTRQNATFYLPIVSSNIEYFAPMLRIQRQHNEIFNNVQLNDPNLHAFKRYINHEINEIQQTNQ